MPKKRRDKKVSLTKVALKGLPGKQKVILDLRSCVEKYTSVYVYTVINMRSERMRQIREEWRPSRFVYGKNKVMALAFGRDRDNEMAPDLHKIGKVLKGPCGLLFTDCADEDVMDWFENFAVEEYARANFKVNKTITLNAGPLKQFPHSMEPYLREKLGLPTKLDRGVVTLIKDFEVCKAGNPLTPEQARILELFEHKLSVFKFRLKAKWTKLGGFEKLSEDGDENGGAAEEGDEAAEEGDEAVEEDEEMDSDD